MLIAQVMYKLIVLGVHKMKILGRFGVVLFALAMSKMALAVPVSFDFDLMQQNNFLQIQSSGSFTLHTDDASLADGFLSASEISSVELSLNGYNEVFTNIFGELAFDYNATQDFLSMTIGVTGDPNTVDKYLVASGNGSLQFSMITGPGGATNFWSSIGPSLTTYDTVHLGTGEFFTLNSGNAYGVPESASLVLLAIGLLGFGFAGRRKRA